MLRSAPAQEVSLWGEDHVEFGEIAAKSLNEAVAIAISKGKYPKGYPTLDPNEDAVWAATAGGSTTLAVVDGHRGFDAARGALRSVAHSAAELLSSDGEPHCRIEAVLRRARAGVRRALEHVEPERAMSKTTLAMLVVEADTVAVGGFGDSDVKLVEESYSRSLWRAAPFLGPDTDLDDAWYASVSLRSDAWLVVGTDGVFDFLGRGWARKLESLAGDTPVEFARSTIEAAFEGGAGDHSAVAVMRSTVRRS